MSEELGFLIYPDEQSKLEDSLCLVMRGACDCLSKSTDAMDQSVGIALAHVSGQWAEMVKKRRRDANEIDRVADEQQ